MVLYIYIYIKYCENICHGLKLERISFHTKNMNGQNSVNNVGTESDIALYLCHV